MNTGQSILSIGALLILSLTVLRVNNKILITDEVLIDSKIGILANSIAVSIIEKANKKNFDHNTTGGEVPLSGLTAPGALTWNHSDPNDTPPDLCDDFDDFNGYTQQDTFFNSVIFSSTCEVVYVDSTNPDSKVTSGPTWHKKLTVKTTWRQTGDPVNTPSDTFKLSTLFSYWYF
jgi:hypothetical protein